MLVGFDYNLVSADAIHYVIEAVSAPFQISLNPQERGYAGDNP
jgi:hypothetical protein